MTPEQESKEEKLGRLQTKLLAVLSSSSGILFIEFIDSEGVRELWAKASQVATKPSRSIRENVTPKELEAWYRVQWSELGATSEVLISVGGLAALPWAKIRLLPDSDAGNWLPKLGDVILLSTDRRRAVALFAEENQYESFFLTPD